jgi:hypothetical protein
MSELEPKDQPDTNDLLGMILLQLMRNYDLLLWQIPAEERQKFIDMHTVRQDGTVDGLCPDPFLGVEDDDA